MRRERLKEENRKTNFWSILWSYYKNEHVSQGLFALGFFLFGSLYSSYLGYRINPSNLILGIFILLFYLLGMEFLNLIFLDDTELERSFVVNFGAQNFKLIFFLLAAAMIGAGLVISIVRLDDQTSLFISGGIILTIFLYTVKPVRLIFSGYGEILQAFLVAFLIPSLGYSIQVGGNVHYNLVYLCLPFYFLVLAHQYIMENKSLSRDIQKYRTTAVMRFGSEITLRIAIYLIVFSYIFMLLLGLSKLPWRFVVRWYISIPVAVYLIGHLNNILSGKKPNWALIDFLSNGLVWLNLLLMASALLFLWF